MDIRHDTKRLSIISTDITRHCNARCKFCFNDWSMYTPYTMSADILKKALSILPFANKNAYYFSCLFEPSIHPQFVELLGMLPQQYRDCIFFTTNLVRKLSDEEIRAMCQSHVHHINISLETWNEETYKHLAGVKQSYFYDNLKRLGECAQHEGTRIRLITMLIKSNADEMVDLVCRAHELVHPFEHEIRTPYFLDSSQTVMTYIEDELLTRDEINAVVSQLNELPFGNILLDTSTDKERYTAAKAEFETNGAANSEEHEFSYSYVVRIDPSGAGHFLRHGEHDKYCFDLATIEDPFLFFSRALIDLQKDEAAEFVVDKPTFTITCDEVRDSVTIDDVVVLDQQFVHICGTAPKLDDGEKRYVLLTSNTARQALFRTIQISVHDDYESFECIVDRCSVDMQGDVKLYVGHTSGKQLSMHYVGSICHDCHTFAEPPAAEDEQLQNVPPAQHGIAYRAARKLYRTVKHAGSRHRK